MDARRGDARVRRGSAHRTRLVRHSAVADALDQRPDERPPARRVAGQPARRRSEAVAGRAWSPAPAPETTVEPYAANLLALSYRVEPPPVRSPAVRRAVVVTLALAVLVAGVTGFLLTHGESRHAATPAVAPTASLVQAENWIRQNVSRQNAVRADASVSAALFADGYTAASVYLSLDSDSAGSVLVTTREIRAQVGRGLATAASSISAVPVATFGSGAWRVDVALLVAGRAAALQGRVARETTERKAAGRGLATNPHVAVPDALRPWLADGGLDLRAATLLALLAARTDERITRITSDAAEAAAGRPARTLALTITDPAVLADVLRQLPPAYAPARVSTLPGDARQLTWPFGLAPEGLF
jgi:hypothetical protein